MSKPITAVKRAVENIPVLVGVAIYCASGMVKRKGKKPRER